MTEDTLETIIEEAAKDIRERLGEIKTGILAAAARKLEETQDTDGKSAVLSIPIALKIDLAQSPVTWKASAKVGATYTSEGDEHVADEGPDLFGKGAK